MNGVNHLINSEGRSTVLMIALNICDFLGPPGPKNSPENGPNWGLLQSLGVHACMLGHRINFYFHLSKKSKFNFGTEKISLDEQYILGSDSGQMETRTVNALFVEMQHMEQYCCEISEGQ